MKFYRNIYWAWKVLFSRSFMVVTDNEAVCSIPLIDPDNVESVARLEFQATVLGKIKESLIRLEKEHKDAITLVKRRQRGNTR